ncbi:IS66-like element accessory protein TnpA [Rhizorhapis sp. SPR117]|uniref:IS66-like element accessory protein TnpA n=1 Tax=Rhizorhapis sp. SPR117 TaxID=2912611 RepID=UPI00403EC20E
MGDETDFETCFETTAPGRVQRLDVIESSRGKRHWTPEARARIIAESLEPGANVSAVARRHGLYPQQLYTWRRGLRERAEAMSFVPAMVERDAGVLPGRPPQSVGGQIVIETGNLTIRVPDDVSADHIERVLLAVQVSA